MASIGCSDSVCHHRPIWITALNIPRIRWLLLVKIDRSLLWATRNSIPAEVALSMLWRLHQNDSNIVLFHLCSFLGCILWLHNSFLCSLVRTVSRLVSTMDYVDRTDLSLPMRIKKRVGTVILSGIFEEFVWSEVGRRRGKNVLFLFLLNVLQRKRRKATFVYLCLDQTSGPYHYALSVFFPW